MRVISNITDVNWSLVKDEEFVSLDEAKKSAYITFGWVRPYDIIDPKGIIVYIDGESYPPLRQVFKDNAVYRSKLGDNTSTTWILSEWDLILLGAS